MNRLLMLMIAVVFLSCNESANTGHSHGEGGSHTHAEDGRPTVSQTIWTDQTELFVEYPSLVVGQVSRFAAHFTILDKHQPVREGSVTVSLIKGNEGIRQQVDGPSSPGIFTPSLRPKEVGTYTLIFEVKTASLTDKIVVNNITVFASEEEAKGSEVSGENGNAISFLKEQAWKMGFQTAAVTESEIYDVISTHGIWRVAPSDDLVLVAPATGVLKFKPRFFTEGKEISVGEVLMEVTSSDLTANNLEAEVQKAKVTLDQREAAFNRISELYESKIVSKTDYEKAKEQYLLAKTHYKTLTTGYTGKGKQVKAPFNGFILEMYAKNGTYTEQGTPLLKVTIDENHMLETKVATRYAAALENINDLLYQNGEGGWSSPDCQRRKSNFNE